MSLRLREHLTGITQTIAQTKLARVFIVLVLAGYVALGFQTYLSFQAPLTQDLDTYVNAFLRASKGMDPYVYEHIWYAYLYPLPALLIVGAFSALPAGLLRATVYAVVNLALLAWMLRSIAQRYGYQWKDVWWWFPLAFGFAPLFELLHMGQINLITSFGIFLMFAYSGVLPVLAGLGLVVAIVTKLMPVVFFVYLALQRRYRETAWGLGILAGAYAVSYFLFGWQPPSTYLQVVSNLAKQFNGPISTALVSVLNLHGWLEPGAWTEVQRLLLVWIAVIFAASGISALGSKQWEPLFVVMGFGTAVVSNHLWYHYYVFLLLPLFVWIAWSRLHPVVIGWCFIGLTLIQVENRYWPQGILPHLFAHISMLSIVVWQLAHAVQFNGWARVLIKAGTLPTVLLVGWFLHLAVDANTNLFNARVWIGANLPAGALLAIEAPGPAVGRQYSAGEFQDLFAHSPDWYEQNGWEYIVTGYGTFAGLDYVPMLPATWAKRYDDFFAKFTPVTRVAGNTHEIRIYQTAATGPAQRVSARFGFFLGEWLDLVGYDARESTWLAGAPANFTFYWRTVERRRNSLQLTARLLDRFDQAVASSVGTLFPATNTGERWPEGIARVPWRIGVPANATPGLYRVELNVDSAGLGRMNVLPYADQPLSDKLYIGPFKIAPPLPAPDELRRAQPVNARFGDTLALRGYSIDAGAARSGETLRVKLYWQSTASTDKDYTIFLHLLDANDNVRAQTDAQPFHGAYPTSIWDAGAVVRDEYALELPRDLAAGDYRLVLGLYEYPSLARLPVTNARGAPSGDYVILVDALRLGP